MKLSNVKSLIALLWSNCWHKKRNWPFVTLGPPWFVILVIPFWDWRTHFTAVNYQPAIQTWSINSTFFLVTHIIENFVRWQKRMTSCCVLMFHISYLSVSVRIIHILLTMCFLFCLGQLSETGITVTACYEFFSVVHNGKWHLTGPQFLFFPHVKHRCEFDNGNYVVFTSIAMQNLRRLWSSSALLWEPQSSIIIMIVIV